MELSNPEELSNLEELSTLEELPDLEVPHLLVHRRLCHRPNPPG